MTLEERLKYWHINCVNCGNKLEEIPKDDKWIVKVIECSDCKKKLNVYVNHEFNKGIPVTETAIILNCIFNLTN